MQGGGAAGAIFHASDRYRKARSGQGRTLLRYSSVAKPRRAICLLMISFSGGNGGNCSQQITFAADGQQPVLRDRCAAFIKVVSSPCVGEKWASQRTF